MNEGATVGIVGLGLIGTALAKRLLGAGFRVIGADIDKSARDRLEEMGGRLAASAAEIAATCDRFLIAVFDTRQVEGVLEGKDGLAAAPPAAGPRTALVASTCDPDRIAALAERMKPKGIDLLEIPLSGSSGQVAAGEAVALVGGDTAAMERSADILAAIGMKAFHMGPVGAGGRAKLAINLILGLNRAALAEGLVYAERLGLEAARFLKVARVSAAYSQIMDVKGAKMAAGDFAPQGKVTQSLKDFDLILESAAAAGQRLPLAEIYRELIEGCMAAGEGEWDNSAIIQEIRRARSNA